MSFRVDVVVPPAIVDATTAALYFASEAPADADEPDENPPNAVMFVSMKY
jgi:hypothetical protein